LKKSFEKKFKFEVNCSPFGCGQGTAIYNMETNKLICNLWCDKAKGFCCYFCNRDCSQDTDVNITLKLIAHIEKEKLKYEN
jgi:hypothetical protein